MTARLLLAAALVAGALAPLGAQTMVGSKPKAPLEASQKELQQLLGVVRDSVVASRTAVARLQRDLTTGSDPLIEASADRLARACGAADRSARLAHSRAQALVFSKPTHRQAVQRFLPKLAEVSRTLEGCHADFVRGGARKGGTPAALRKDGALRAERIRTRLLEYDREAQTVAAQVEIRVLPSTGVLGPLDG